MGKSHGSASRSGNGKTKGNGRTNWKEMALSLRRAVEEQEVQLTKLRMRYEELRMKGLTEREHILLGRLRSLVSRIINLRVSEESRTALDTVLKELDFIPSATRSLGDQDGEGEAPDFADPPE